MTEEQKKLEQVKKKTYRKLMTVYSQHGFASTLEVARAMMNSQAIRESKPLFHAVMNGEICETVLVCKLLDMIKTKPECANWAVGKGLILKDRENTDSNFLTELDVTLFTENTIYLFECKSYGGANTLSGNGTITRTNGKMFDVWDQSVLHHNILRKWVLPFVEPKGKPDMQMVLFHFDNGKWTDQRSSLFKEKLPLVDVNTVSELITVGGGNWAVNELGQAVVKIQGNSDKLLTKHRDYVIGLH